MILLDNNSTNNNNNLTIVILQDIRTCSIITFFLLFHLISYICPTCKRGNKRNATDPIPGPWFVTLVQRLDLMI